MTSNWLTYIFFLDVSMKAGQDDIRPLHLACRYNAAAAVAFLLTQRADVNVKDSKGRTPLHYATRRGHDTVTKVQSLHYATCRGHDTVTKVQSLHYATRRGHDTVTKVQSLLLKVDRPHPRDYPHTPPWLQTHSLYPRTGNNPFTPNMRVIGFCCTWQAEPLTSTSTCQRFDRDLWPGPQDKVKATNSDVETWFWTLTLTLNYNPSLA